MDKKRYFIVFYKGQVGLQEANGHMDFIVSNYSFLPKAVAIKRIEKAYEGLEKVTITNIIEVPASDYKDWQEQDTTPITP